nr:MAG TPA: hypothetical protein [Crassvirales sp.]
MSILQVFLYATNKCFIYYLADMQNFTYLCTVLRTKR